MSAGDFWYDARFHDEHAAYRYVEGKLWPHGPVCPNCHRSDRIGRMNGQTTRIGTYKCYNCRKPFTVKIGTIFESSHLPLRLWLQAIYLIATHGSAMSPGILQQALGVTRKTAGSITRRIRSAEAQSVSAQAESRKALVGKPGDAAAPTR
jgi:transposase-like protein